MQESQFIQVLSLFNGASFSTLHFIERYREHFPGDWERIQRQHGQGGKGAKTRYSAYSRMAHHLHRFTRLKRLHTFDYRKAPIEWGSAKIRYWCEFKEEAVQTIFDEDEDTPATFTEGAVREALARRHQRSLKARAVCIQHHGLKCTVCTFDFEAVYGPRGAGYIHVHHLNPIAAVGQRYELNPITELRPLCPNCHAMAHRYDPVMSIRQLQALLDEHANAKPHRPTL